MTNGLLDIEDLHIEYRTRDDDVRAVNGADISIGPNEYFGIVGESGCGKSTIAQAIIGGMDDNAEITEGTIQFKGEEIQDFSEEEFSDDLRWTEIAFIPQSAMNCLDPLHRISAQAVELVQEHTDQSEDAAVDKLRELFDVVGLPQSRIHDYPHQFSGGMRQRAIIALSLILEPSLLIADEPTTALDVIMQDQILNFLQEIREDRDVSLLLITHDISVIFENCDTLAVMHGGQVCESGPVQDLLDHPQHPYTYLLQKSFPDIRYPERKLEVIDGYPPVFRGEVSYCSFVDRCPWAVEECNQGAPPLEPNEAGSAHKNACIRSSETAALFEEYDVASGERDTYAQESQSAVSSGLNGQVEDAGGGPVLELDELERFFDPSANIIDTIKNRLGGKDTDPIRAVDGINLSLERNQVQGVIGESGCGKTTLLMTLIGQYAPTSGAIRFHGDRTSEFSKGDWRNFRRRVQVIYQDPFNSINPKFSVRDALAEPLNIHDITDSPAATEERILDVLDLVELNPPEHYIDMREPQLSGGEKQRVSIARALIVDPDIILADEPVSMLDVSTQAAILQLLDELTDKQDVSMLYISHDLSTVSYICDVVNVMYLGRIVERASTMDILDDPKHPYTQALIDAIPVPEPGHRELGLNIPGTPGDASDLPSGCRFKDRCPERMEICEQTPPFEYLDENVTREVACHLYGDEGQAEHQEAPEVQR